MLTRAPADIFDLPQKGRFAIGADADVALVDVDLVKTVDPAALGSYADYSLYEGDALRGWPTTTIVRGQRVMQDGAIVGPAGFGRYLHRALPE